MPDAPVTALRGTIVSFTGDPFLIDTAESYVHEPDGLIVCRNGIIEAVGAYDIYNHYGLVRRRTVLGNCVWFSDSGFASVHERDASIAHCPTSNLCLGSGQFRLRLAKDKKRPIHVGLGTDIGAGTSFSLLRTINEAYKIAALNAAPMPSRRFVSPRSEAPVRSGSRTASARLRLAARPTSWCSTLRPRRCSRRSLARWKKLVRADHPWRRPRRARDLRGRRACACKRPG